MGVDTRFYAVYGVCMTEWDDAFYDEYDEKYDLTEGKCPIVFDGMSGEYFVMGHQFMETESMRYEMPYGFTSIDPMDLEEYKQEYISNFHDVFPNWTHLLDGPWEIHVFVHYS